MVPFAAPTEVGKKATCIVRDFPGRIEMAVEKPVWENGKVRVTPETLNEVVPVFVMVSAWLVLVPIDWLAKVRDFWLTVAIAVELVPVPLNVTFWFGRPVIITVALPAKALAVLGLKVTGKFTNCPVLMVTGKVPVITNWETEDVMPVTVMVVEPMLYTVKTWDVLTVPDFCGAKESPVGSTEAAVPANAGRVAINIPQRVNRRRQNLTIRTS
jgi:hypothetical protein